MADGDANIELWHQGVMANLRGEPCPTEPHGRAGWLHREREKRVRVVMPVRPEGYYHAPIGTFD